MNANVSRQLLQRKGRIAARLDKNKIERVNPVFRDENVQYELSDRTRAVACGGISLIHQMIHRLEMSRPITRSVSLFEVCPPYSEADHVPKIAYNLLVGGTCRDHLELRRNDEVYLDALGVQRIPDLTTAGAFCRRFTRDKIQALMEAFNRVRVRVWQQQPASFLDHALIDAHRTTDRVSLVGLEPVATDVRPVGRSHRPTQFRLGGRSRCGSPDAPVRLLPSAPSGGKVNSDETLAT